jgi:hypothetical protein
VLAGELAGRVQTAPLRAVLPEQRDVVEHLGGVAADPAEDAGGGERGEVGVAGQQADPEHDPVEVGTFEGPERHLVVADQRRDVFAPRDRCAQLPQHPPDDQVAAAGVAKRGDPSVRLGLGAERLGGVVQQHRGEQPDPFVGGAGPPVGQGGEGLAGHPGVSGDVALGVVYGVLRHAGHRPYPGERVGDPCPVDSPLWRRGAEFVKRSHT